MTANTIDEVIDILGQIIQESKDGESTFGYFAALYQKVTISIKERLNTNYFDDDERMERLDVVFANRYLKAYASHQRGDKITESWKTAFTLAEDDSVIVLQHLLLGMNAHINLDLGIAASEISDTLSIGDLQSDFNKINEVLAALIEEVQGNLAEIWPTLLWILRLTRKVDDYMVNFSMNLARNGAWKFANELVLEKDQEKRETLILQRDTRVAELTNLIIDRGIVGRIIFMIIRFGERGTPSDKIRALERTIEKAELPVPNSS
ncbi:MAG: DUF5995 family protein [Cyclobacteriaceae bacterium]